MVTSALGEVIADLRRHLDWQESNGGTVLLAGPADRRVARSAAPEPLASVHPPVLPGPVAVLPSSSAPSRESVPPPAPAATALEGSTPRPVRTLETIRADLGDCRRCKLCQGRTQLVFGVGNPKAELVFVGEGPGEEEDRQGIPFVGKAGQLLTKMIEAMGFTREQVYIANVVKCRPPNNRNPEPDEIEACEPFLKAQLAAIQPKAIVALGKFAAQTLLRDTTPITRLRGQWRQYESIPLMPTFHPAYLLRQPGEKKLAWADLQQVMKLFGKERA